MEPRLRNLVDDDKGTEQLANRYIEVISSPEMQEAFKAWISVLHDNSVLAGEREAGRKEGREIGREIVAKNMLEMGFDTETIVKITEFTKKRLIPCADSFSGGNACPFSAPSEGTAC
ncbi:MAG: hypothetical protein LBP92_06640 [Deltaproteobacteria bacterium]|jgi:hypothetical protein|nr:hypothetical protein [Deltaproteobacteria bacterium]